MIRYLIAHWRGEQSLAWSYWVNVTLLSLAVLLAIGLVEEPMSRLELQTAITIALLLILLVSALNVWQLVGLWRSAGNTMRRSAKRFWPVVARIVVVFGAIYGAGTVVTATNDLRKASLALQEPDLAEYELQRVPGEGLLLTGAINDRSAGEVMEMLGASEIRILRIDSYGGLIEPAARLARFVRREGVLVLVESQCWSACVWILAASEESAIYPWARVTFHRAEPIADFSTPEINAGFQDYLDEILAYDREFGIPEWVVHKVRREEFWTPTINELIEIGVIAQIYEPEAAALVPARDYCARHADDCASTPPD